MLRSLFAVLVVICIAACSESNERGLGPTSLAPVRIGMTHVEAAKALGVTLTPQGEGEEESCWYTHRADTQPGTFVDYMVIDGHIARIDVHTIDVKTAQGIGTGATLAEVQEKYAGPRLTVTPHKYADAPRSHYVRLADLEPSRGIVFEVVDGKVVSMRGGRIPEIDWVEGCS